MQPITLTLKNFRCFPDTRPLRLELKPGITAFVGINNSGKSALLKFFGECRFIWQLFQSPHTLVNVLNGGRAEWASVWIADVEELFCSTAARDIEIIIDVPYDGKANRVELVLKRDRQLSARFNGFESRGFELGENAIVHRPSASLFPMAFFETMQCLQTTQFIGAYRNVINSDGAGEYFDIKVGKKFVDLWRELKMGANLRMNRLAFKLTDDIRHIFGFTSFDINPSSDGATLKVMVDGQSYRLAELGSGVAQFIMVLTQVAMATPSFILIDEPELHLHPSLQLDFITTLASYASEGVLFSTHSIGLARSSADRVLSFQKKADGTDVRNFEENTDLGQLLGELSYSGYRDLGYDSVLLVEGATEVKTIQQFLRLLQLDHKVVLVPMGGSQIINDASVYELNELARLSTKMSCLIDSERVHPNIPADTKRQKFVETCRSLHIACHMLNRRAMENYFTDRAVKQVKGNSYRALAECESLKEVTPRWAKSENWRIAREMKRDELEGTDLWQFLTSLQ